MSISAVEVSLAASDNPASIEWVKIPSGEFLYGRECETAFIRKPFLIGKYPVTQVQYQIFIDANPDYPVPYNKEFPFYCWDQKTRQHPSDKANHPVVLVNWENALAFCRWAKCRLPNDAEWEKAARGTDGSIFPWSESWLNLNKWCAACNVQNKKDAYYCENCGAILATPANDPNWVAGKFCNSREATISGTTPVDDFPLGVSPYGVWDMSGNVWEMMSSRFARGGSWLNKVCDATTTFAPLEVGGFTGYIDLGFRCARDIP